MPDLARRRIIGDNVMISQVRLNAGCVVPMHQHENEQIACVVSGALRFTFDQGNAAGEIIVRAGEALLLPANAPHAAEALEETLVLDVFAPPSQTTGIDRH